MSAFVVDRHLAPEVRRDVPIVAGTGVDHGGLVPVAVAKLGIAPVPTGLSEAGLAPTDAEVGSVVTERPVGTAVNQRGERGSATNRAVPGKAAARDGTAVRHMSTHPEVITVEVHVVKAVGAIESGPVVIMSLDVVVVVYVDGDKVERIDRAKLLHPVSSEVRPIADDLDGLHVAVRSVPLTPRAVGDAENLGSAAAAALGEVNLVLGHRDVEHRLVDA